MKFDLIIRTVHRSITVGVLPFALLVFSLVGCSKDSNPVSYTISNQGGESENDGAENDQDNSSNSILNFSFSNFLTFIDTDREGMIYIKDIQNRYGESSISEYDVVGNISDNQDNRVQYGDLTFVSTPVGQTPNNQWFHKVAGTSAIGSNQSITIKNASQNIVFTFNVYVPKQLDAVYNYSAIEAGNTITWNADAQNSKGLLLAFVPMDSRYVQIQDAIYSHVENDNGSYTIKASDVSGMDPNTKYAEMILIRGDYDDDVSTTNSNVEAAVYVMNGVKQIFEVPSD